MPNNGSNPGGNSASTTWDATGVFKGSSAYEGTKAATTNTSYAYTYYSFRITGVSKVQVLANSNNKTQKVIMGAFEISTGTAANSTLLYDECTNSNTTLELSLDKSKEYLITLCANANSTNSRVFEMALFYDESVTLTAPATVAASGYTTFAYGGDLDFANAVETGTSNKTLKAYVVSSLTSTSVTLTEVSEAPAGTGVVLKGTPNTTYDIPQKADAADAGTNSLEASISGKSVDANTVYVVSGGKFCLFTGTKIPAGKAYLPKSVVDAVGSAPEFLAFDFGIGGETTGISTMHNSQCIMHNDFFDLQGRRVALPSKGLYIVNGKKIVIK